MMTTFSNSLGNFKFLTVLLTASFLLWGCDAASPQGEIGNSAQGSTSASGSEDSWSAQEFRSIISDNLTHVGNYLEAHDATFADRDIMRQALLDYQEKKFGVNSEEYENAKKAFDEYVAGDFPAGNSRRVEDLPVNVQEVIQDVDAAIGTSKNYDAFQQNLTTIQESIETEVANGDWSDKERKMALSHVVAMQETMNFVKAHQSLYVQNGFFDWFDRYQCIAGTISGALTGGWIGNEIAGTPGAIVGVIVGGVYGAVANCD